MPDTSDILNLLANLYLVVGTAIAVRKILAGEMPNIYQEPGRFLYAAALYLFAWPLYLLGL